MYRRSLREQTFKLLFRVEFNSEEAMAEQKKLFFQNDDVTFTEKDREEIEAKFARITELLPGIDGALAEAAEGWDLSRIGKVELTILRLAVYELRYDSAVPEGVAINEAVELCKKFGQEGAPSFVNAVLSRFTEEGRARAERSAAAKRLARREQTEARDRERANVYIVKAKK
ncbi:transcription antitermination factor NusB [Lachnoclostridium sp. Marseille-P6806]|uniref:transcription antitermination factor NusB n=1 Tax=Lachnoclostridium sp. Marseille-P6806 TaxID=2364793 RepID=UPI00102F6EE2